MRKNGAEEASLYFSPLKKEQRDTYRVLSMFPRKKTEFITCLVQKWLLENGIVNIDDVTDDDLRKLFKKELKSSQDISVTKTDPTIMSLLSVILKSKEENSSSNKDKAVSKKESKKLGNQMNVSEDINKPDIIETKDTTSTAVDNDSYDEDIDTVSEDNEDDTTGLLADWKSGLTAFEV